MNEKYEMLYNKYKGAILSIRELESEKERTQQKNENIIKEYRVLSKHIRKLCKTILKETEREKENEWSQMSLLNLINEAQTSMDEFSRNAGTLTEIIRKGCKKRDDKIKQLREQIAKDKQKQREGSNAESVADAFRQLSEMLHYESYHEH